MAQHEKRSFGTLELLGLKPYSSNVTVLAENSDYDGILVVCAYANIPDQVPHYAVGCILIASDTGAAYTNTGTRLLCTFAALGAAITGGSVTSAGLGTSSVTAGKIADTSIAAGKIATNAVTSAKIASSAVAASKVADASIAAGKIASNAVTSAKIASSAVVASKIKDLGVTSAKIASSAIAAGKIADTSIAAGKIASNAVIAGKVKYAAVSVAVSSGATSGVAATSAGAVIIGFVPINTTAVANVIKSISKSAASTAKVLLATSANHAMAVSVITLKAA